MVKGGGEKISIFFQSNLDILCDGVAVRRLWLFHRLFTPDGKNVYWTVLTGFAKNLYHILTNHEKRFFSILYSVIFSFCGRVCGHYFFLVTERKYLRATNMDGEEIHLGKSIRVTLTSHEVARLAEMSGLMQYFLDSDLRTRWSKPLHFPEEVVSKRNLLILLGRKNIYKPTFEVIHFVRMCHYLLINEYDVYDLLNMRCFRCKFRSPQRACKHTHYNEMGTYNNDNVFIPVLYFAHYVAKWDWLYQTLLKFLNLRFFEIDESWPYRTFKKKLRDMFHSRDRWFDDKHFFKGNWRRENCRCRLCDLGPPDSDGDGWV